MGWVKSGLENPIGFKKGRLFLIFLVSFVRGDLYLILRFNKYKAG